MAFSNTYDDAARAAAYSTLEFPGTYYLAYRDLPEVIARHVTGREALDFGCGTGRSTRFLKSLGFSAAGLDISQNMIQLATKADPGGTYHLVRSGDFRVVESKRFDLILSAFAFDNIPDVTTRRHLLHGLRGLLAAEGRLVLLGSTSDIYLHEWASFTTKAFPQNRRARSGDQVQIVMKDVVDSRPVTDVLWQHEDYLKLYAAAGIDLVEHHTPIGRSDEPYPWISETSIAPWFIDVLEAT